MKESAPKATTESGARTHLESGLSSNHARDVGKHENANEGVAVIVEVDDLWENSRKVSSGMAMTLARGSQRGTVAPCGSLVMRRRTHVVLSLALVSVGHLLEASQVRNSNTELLGLGRDGSKTHSILAQFSQLVVGVAFREVK